MIIILFILNNSNSEKLLSAYENEYQKLSKILNSNTDETQQPDAHLYSKGDIIFCTGNDIAGLTNNEAADLMEKGEFASAKQILEKALKHSPLFFPFRYNIGLCYIHQENLAMAEYHLEKAVNIFPEYFKTYIRLGYIFERKDKEDIAIDYYRKALKLNPRAKDVYVSIGNIYLQRNQLGTAEKYYNTSLEIEQKSPNAHLGVAKIYFIKENYINSLVIIKSIDLKDEYDKSLHFYYAECAYKLQDYKTARDQYEKLLQFKTDKFFLTTSVSLIKYKIGLCERFIEVKSE